MPIDLVAAGVADPHNLAALAAAAAMFNANYFSLNPKGALLRGNYDLVLALDNVPGAHNLFDYRPPPGACIALLVGNEQRGLTPGLLRAADAVLQIPMRAPGGAALNVAAAAAVALWQLGTACARRPAGHNARPAAVFVQPRDPATLGSALRSAWALGWQRAELLDSHAVWFTADRATFAQGRGAARRHKNALQVHPWSPLDGQRPLLVSASGPGTPLWRAAIPPGPRALVLIPDESSPPASWPEVHRVTLGIPGQDYDYHYHLLASIALAELARRTASLTT